MTTSNRSRFFDFRISRETVSLSTRIHAMLRHFLGQHAKAIEPNWYQIVVEFGENENDLGFLDRAIDEQDACRVSFDYRPKVVTLVGPKHGHTDWTKIALQLAPEQLFMLVCLSQRLFGDTRHVLRNPRHRIEVLAGKTVLAFKSGREMVVGNVRDGSLDMFGINGEDIFSPRSTHLLSTDGVIIDLMSGDPESPYSGFSYLPYLPMDGMPMDTPEAIRKARAQAKKGS